MTACDEHRLDEFLEPVRLVVLHVSKAGVGTLKRDLRNTVVDTLAGGIDEVHGVSSGSRRSLECCYDIRHVGFKPELVEGRMLSPAAGQLVPTATSGLPKQRASKPEKFGETCASASTREM